MDSLKLVGFFWRAKEHGGAAGRNPRSANRSCRQRAVLLWGKRALALVVASLWLGLPASCRQLESVAGPPPSYVWESQTRVSGHLALAYSPTGAFSPDSSVLAVAEKDGVALVKLSAPLFPNIVRPRIPGITDLEIQSAYFVSPTRLFLLASGTTRKKRHHRAARIPQLAFQWSLGHNALVGKVDTVGASGGLSSVRYFPRLRSLAVYKHSVFQVWNPETGQGGHFSVPELANTPRLFLFSPNSRWLLLAQIDANSSPNPIVVSLATHQFVNVLLGHRNDVLGMAFSPDSKEVVTACADGRVRIFSTHDWSLVKTLLGNRGPVHWAAFSPRGHYVASAGEDSTVRIWKVSSGKLVQTLRESHSPLLTLVFSSNGEYLAASSEDHVYVWIRKAMN